MFGGKYGYATNSWEVNSSKTYDVSSNLANNKYKYKKKKILNLPYAYECMIKILHIKGMHMDRDSKGKL